jgi:CubicO group peptidase (beta-lactamase class C family)
LSRSNAFHALILTSILGSFPSAAIPDTPKVPQKTLDAVQDVLQDSVDRYETLGAVAGIVTPQGKWTWGAGSTRLEGGWKPDGDTYFEIGSLSKVFLDLLLEEAIREGRVRMTDPVASHLPPDMPFPRLRKKTPGGRKPSPVNLWHLATHTSGFPTMPSRVDLPPEWDPKDPSYVTLDMARIFFERFHFGREPGVKYEYSNINTALLGYILSLRDGRDLETLLKERVLLPLGMKDTLITLDETREARLARGYTAASEEAGYINTPIPFSGGGSLRSTANDLLKYLERALDLAPCDLQEAMAQQTRLIQKDDGPERSVGYFFYPQPYGDVYLIRSRTLGFRCCMGFIPSRRIGAVIMGNCMRFDTPEVFRKVLEAAVLLELRVDPATGLEGKGFAPAPEGAFEAAD